MKKFLLVAIITFGAVLNFNKAFSQTGGLGGSCPQKDLIQKYTEATDSLARFFAYLRRTTDSKDYESFVDDMATDSIEAFNIFGSRSSDLKDSMQALIDSLNTYTLSLQSIIDPYNTMSLAAFSDTLYSRITCFLSDTSVNTIDYLFEKCAGTGQSILRVAGDLDCRANLGAALTAARASYNYANIACLGFGSCSTTGLYRLLCVGACLAATSIVYDRNKTDAFCDYFDCMGRSCPFFLE
jgi:hypothetical protein